MTGHKFKKRFGQNFLRNSSIAKRIADSVDNSVTNLIEIGPGEGKLTQELLTKGFKVTAVEIDPDVYPKLQEKFGENPNFNLIPKSILEFNFDDFQDKQYSVVGNLPYNISKPIIKIFLQAKNQPYQMLFMIQKEVADDYTAKVPKGKFLGNFVNLFGQISYLFTVRKTEFHPEPKVDGGVISIFPKNTVNQDIIKFIKIGFQNPRKTLINSLSTLFNKELVKQALQKLQINEKVRPAEVTTEEWIQLFELIKTSNETNSN